MMEKWVILALIGGLASSLVQLVTRKALEKEDPTAFAWWFELLRAATFLILALFNFKLNLNRSNLVWFLGLGLAETAAIYFFVKMQSLTQLSIAMIVTRLRLVWVPLFAWLIIGEKLTLLEYLGMGLLFLGLITVATPKTIKADKGVRYGLLFSISAAVLSILMKITSQFASTPIVIMFMSVPAVLMLPILMKNTKLRLISSFKKRIKANILFLMFGVISMYLFVEAVRIGPVSKVAGVYQSMVILAVLWGIVVLKERERIGWKITGSLITLAGIWLLVG